MTFDGAGGALLTGRACSEFRAGGAGGAEIAGGAVGRGATIGRAVNPLGTAVGALPGIMGRGGKSTGRTPPAGAGDGFEFSGLVTGVGALAAGGSTGGTAGTVGIGVGGAGGENASRNAAAIPAFPRCPVDASASLRLA